MSSVFSSLINFSNGLISGILPVINGGTGVTTSTGTGNNVLSTSPTLVTPILGAATATSVVFSPSTGGIVGTTAIDDAGSGFVGRYLENKTAAGTSVGTSGQWFNAGTLTLTAGDWDVWGEVSYSRNGATVTSVELDVGISTVTGNSSSGLVEAATLTFFAPGGGMVTYGSIAIQAPLVRVQSNGTDLKINGSTLPATQVIFLKGFHGTYTTATPQYAAILRAREVR